MSGISCSKGEFVQCREQKKFDEKREKSTGKLQKWKNLCLSMLFLPSTDPSTSRGDIGRDITGTNSSSSPSRSSLHVTALTIAVGGNSSSNTKDSNASDCNKSFIICKNKKKKYQD
jgi:hypothetical protein